MTETTEQTFEDGAECTSCRREVSSARACPCCAEPVCRKCQESLPDDAFQYLTEGERPFAPGTIGYCGACWDGKVRPAVEEYEALVERAKSVFVISSKYRGQVPAEKKALARIEAKELRDKNEVVLRLALVAAREGFNGLIQFDLDSRKERNHGWQKTVWSGSALPAQLNEARLARAEGMTLEELLES